MNTCVNIEAGEFRALKERSGLPDFLLEILVAEYLDTVPGAWPHLDELPISWEDTKKALEQFLELDSKSLITPESLLQKTGQENIADAVRYLNDVYRNLNIDYHTIGGKVKITTDKNPNPFRVEHTEKVDFSGLSSTVYITQALQELERKMGIITHEMTTEELNNAGILQIIPEASGAAAFIYQGDIYVNTDNADVDAKIHELMHVLLGSIKFKNPQLYAQLTSVVESLEDYADQVTHYSLDEVTLGRTRGDINEEIFVKEYAKLLTGLQSPLSQLDPGVLYNLNYEVSRVLDTMLLGDNSVRVIPTKERFSMSLRELGEVVNAHAMDNTIQSYLDTSAMHRILANVKSDLMKSGNLKEECD